MNIATANRLVELRKQHGLSQEDLAAQLGISRQAVSKWERAEASPDTDNLISLAQLYRISLDELLGNTPPLLPQTQQMPVNPLAYRGFPLWFVALVAGILFVLVLLFFIFFREKLAAIYPILCALLYLCIGIFGKKWHPTWLIFLTVPLVEILLA